MRELLKIVTVAGVRATAALLAFITAVFATSVFTSANFGKLSLLWSISSVAAVFLDFGASIAFRKLGHSTSEAGQRVGRSLVSYITRALVLLLPLLVAVFAFSGEADRRIFIFAVPLSLAFAIEALLAEVFRVRQMYYFAEAFSGGFRQIVYLVSLTASTFFMLSIEQFVALLSLTCLAAALFIISTVGKPDYAIHRSYLLGWKSRLDAGEQFRFFCTQALVLAGQQFPLLAAGVLASDEIAATVRISLLFGMLMQFAIAANALYFAPKLARIPPGDEATVVQLVRRSSILSLAFVAAGFVLAAILPLLVRVMFGEAYMPAVPGAQLITITFALSSTFGAYAQMLLMRGQDRINLGGAAATLIAQVAILIPLREIAPVSCYAIAYASGIACAFIYLAYFGHRSSGLWPGAVGSGR